MLEIWRDIKDYEGLYQVSNLGRVKSLEHKVLFKNSEKIIKECLLKPYKVRGGYFQVKLQNNTLKKNIYIHRLVAMTFPDLVDWTEDAKGKPFEELQVNHKNEFDKANNCVDNLEWCDNYYNSHYGTHIERVIQSHLKPVLQYTLDGQFVAEYSSIIEAEKQTGIRHICCCCKGKRKTAGGYIWRYKD